MRNPAIDDRRHLDTVVDLVVGPRRRLLEGFTVNRVWPIPARRLIGPFIFLDHLEDAELPPGAGFDVPPHPHIGLATVTWLFDGELMHADSLGIRQQLVPGELNWMSAGRGITHSERSTPAARAAASRLHGVQSWVALPAADERKEPSFQHVSRAALPLIETDSLRLQLIAGQAFGAESPVQTASPLFYADATLAAGGELDLPPGLGQRGIYIVSGRIEIDGFDYPAGRLLVLADGRDCRVFTADGTRLMLLGGEPLEGEREIWWNFVSSDPAQIEAARRDWADGRFPAVAGDDERMPLPG